MTYKRLTPPTLQSMIDEVPCGIEMHAEMKFEDGHRRTTYDVYIEVLDVKLTELPPSEVALIIGLMRQCYAKLQDANPEPIGPVTKVWNNGQMDLLDRGLLQLLKDTVMPKGEMTRVVDLMIEVRNEMARLENADYVEGH